MAVVKQIVSSKTFLAYTLGCRVNQAETAVISNQLTANSFKPFNKKNHLSPNLVLINTCAVTLKAERESRKAARHFKRLFPKAKIVCLGCAAKFVKDADLIIENSHKLNAVKIILKRFSLTPPGCQAKYFPNLFHKSGRALVKIQEGCDQFCAYCIVPHLRGKPKSTLSSEIICQINKFVGQGIKEIILCGINLSLYGTDLIPRISLTTLIKKILKETKAERISLSSIEPEYLYENKDFVKLFINEPRLSKYFHLALQNGSQETIRNMARKTDLKKLLKTLLLIKEKCREFTFRADIIVGFPTETEKDFQETLDFIEKVPITFCHVFPYSIRPGTLAGKMIKLGKWHDLLMTTKRERVKRVTGLTKQIQKEEAKKIIGKTLPCLIIRKIPGGYAAIANNSWPVKVRITNDKLKITNLKGKIFPIKIGIFQKNFLKGSPPPPVYNILIHYHLV